MTAIPPGWTPEQARKRMEAATPGPWEVHPEKPRMVRMWLDRQHSFTTLVRTSENAAFIAHAPQDIAALLALVDEARKATQFTRDFCRAVFDERDEPKALRMLDAFLARFAAPEDET